MSSENPETKFIVPIKAVEKSIKLDDRAKKSYNPLG